MRLNYRNYEVFKMILSYQSIGYESRGVEVCPVLITPGEVRVRKKIITVPFYKMRMFSYILQN